MSDDALIRLKNLHKSFTLPDGKRLVAVDDVSLDIRRGEVLGLVGRSGAGKSTLLRLVNLLERPERGTVTVDGRELTALGKRALRDARQGIGMIFQQFNLLRNATVFENVAFPLRIHGWRESGTIRARVLEVLEVVGLSDKAASHPAQLSGGQQQRVAIARALAPRPAVLLCDEPTSALDTETTRSILATIARVNRELGVTVVVVTHELEVVASIGTRAAVLENGRVVEQFAVGAASVPRVTAIGREIAALLQGGAQSGVAVREDREVAHV